MIKLIELLVNTKQNDIKIFPSLHTWIPPNKNDTFKSWYEKNNFILWYVDKRNDGYSYKFSNIRTNAYDIFTLHGDYEVEQKEYKLRKIKVKKMIQNKMDNWCGFNRIKVTYKENRIRFIIPTKANEFKMIPDE